jgi:GPH family glycoside/pentoside/hexuronide:cation symporter
MNKGKSILYSSGNFAASLAGSVFSTYVIFYYVDVLKMPAYLIGLAMGVYGIWNAINDPLLGQLSDRTRSRWGRRTPYILFGSIPFVLFFTFVWTPPVGLIGGNITAMLIYFICIVFLFDLLYTLVIINWTSLFPEMYKTQEERTRVSVYRQVFGIVGNIIGVALPPILYAAIGWQAMGIVFGVLTLVFLGLSLLGSREDASAAESAGLPLFKALKATFANRSFLIYVLAAMFLQFTFVMLQAVLPFYAKYVVHVEGFRQSLMVGVIFIMAMLWVTFWGRRANRRGSKSTIILSAAFYAASLIPLLFVGGYYGAVISTALIGVGLAGLMVLLDVMLSDVIDEDELKTGARREGMYFGINGLLVRLAISFQAVIMGFVLDTSGYDADLPVASQPAGAIAGIKVLLVVIPIVSVLIAMLIFSRYPLNSEKLREVKQRLKEKHEKVLTAGEMENAGQHL